MTENDPRRGATSASNAAADVACAARHLAQRGIPEPPQSADAAFGSRIHAALAAESPEGLSLEERDIWEACIKIRDEAIVQFFGSNRERPSEYRERRLWVKFAAANPGGSAIVEYQHSGQPDYVCRVDGRALVIEFKCLAGDIPEAPTNLQLRDQAVLVWRALLTNNLPPQIGTVVVQPLVTHRPAICVYESEDLARAERNMFARVVVSNDPTSPRTPGTVQCEHCLAKSICLEWQRWAGSMVPEVKSLLDVPMAQWTPAQRAEFCDKFDVAQKWINTAWAAMEAGAQKDPNFVPGYAMVPGQKRERIANPQACFDRFLAAGGKQEDFMTAVLVTKTVLKEKLAVATGKKGKALDDMLRTMLDGIVETKVTKPSLKKVEGK
jgi:hypothetical protein